jgi:hypothetical protein
LSKQEVLFERLEQLSYFEKAVKKGQKWVEAGEYKSPKQRML